MSKKGKHYTQIIYNYLVSVDTVVPNNIPCPMQQSISSIDDTNSMSTTVPWNIGKHIHISYMTSCYKMEGSSVEKSGLCHVCLLSQYFN